jgi:acyl dehydratase
MEHAVDLVPGDTLPVHHVRARNLSRDSENRIHDDEVARRHGFAAGLVTGTTVYAYLSHPLVRLWGEAWLEGGTARIRFRRPIYEGDLVGIEARVVGRSGGPAAGEVVLELTVTRDGGELAATAVAGLAWGGTPVRPDLGAYPVRPLPTVRAPATPAALGALGPLGSPDLALDPETAAEYAARVDDPLDLYRGPAGAGHPGLLLQQANRLLSENVSLGPWIHAESDLAHLGLARAGNRLTTRGRVDRLSTHKGREYAELDALVVADGARPVLHVRHTAIYRLPGPG